MPIDRVFTMKGFGTVLTGTLLAGHIKIGDEVAVLPGRSPGAMPLAKVRGIQVHGAPVSEAIAGQRTAINVGIEKELVRRGDTLVLSGSLVTSQVVDARVRLLRSCGRPLKRRSRLLFHSGTTQVLATVSLLDCMKLEPGQDALAQIELDEPIVVLPNDRFILRGFAMQRHHGTTVGGGVVVRTLGARSARPTPAWLEILSKTERASEEERVALEIDQAGAHGIDRSALVIRLPFAPSTLDKQLARLLSEGQVTKFDRERAAFIGKDALALLKSHTLEALKQFHAEHPLADGLPREELRAKITPDPKLLHAITESLSSDGSVSVERDIIRLANAQPSGATTAVSALAQELEQRLLAASLEPPRPAELALTLKKSAQEIASALELLARRDTIVRVKEFFFHRAALAALKERLVAHLRAHEDISPSEWKEMVGTSRKYSIPLAEHFDAERVTLRVGDQRRLRTS
jgi:selenocysteine-specific elongation factor